MNPKNLKALKPLDVKTDIIQIDFDESQYMKEEHPKTQIVLHHSAGWDNARGMFDGWLADKIRVATCCGINDEGKIFQAFGSQYFAYHVNILSAGNMKVRTSTKFKVFCNPKNALDIEQRTIGVEILNWGGLVYKDKKYLSWAGAEVKKEKVVEYEQAYRGSIFFEKYTEQEIEATWKLLNFWGRRYDIPLDYRPYIWDVNTDALAGAPGVYTHCSYRADKQDIHPQEEMIKMLSQLI